MIHRLRSSAVAAILLTPLVISTVAAQATPVSHAERPVASARRAQGRFVLDGRRDDAAWAGAVPVTAFTQLDPEEGRPASERTEVYIIYDAEALYVGGGARGERSGASTCATTWAKSSPCSRRTCWCSR